MSAFLKEAHSAEQKVNAEANDEYSQGDDDEVSTSICAGLEEYITNRCQGRGRKTNKQRRKLRITCRAVRFVAKMHIRIYTRSDFRAPHIRDIHGPDSWQFQRRLGQSDRMILR